MALWHMAGEVGHNTDDSGVILADRTNRYLDLSLEELLTIEVVSGEGSNRQSWLDSRRGSFLVSGLEITMVYPADKINSSIITGDNAVC